MSITSVQLRVTSVRARGSRGGAIFAGYTPDEKYLVAVCSYEQIPDSSLVDKNQHWKISGTMQQRNDEPQIKAISAELVRPSGRNIIDWIKNSEQCRGIGGVKAAELYEEFGPDLVERILAKDIASLTKIINEESAHLLCYAFEKHEVADTLLWLDRLAIPRQIGLKLVEFYQDQARAKIEENPYRLISFCGKWSQVDTMAQQKFGITLDDSRRLDAAVEEALYAGMRNGHTCMPATQVKASLNKLLGNSTLAVKALALDTESTQYTRIGDFLQSAGMLVIETYIAARLRLIASANEGGQQSLWGGALNDITRIDNLLATYERRQGFPFATEQREAVITSTTHNLSLILGGAGTGKTTVLKALYGVMENEHEAVGIHQVALAGMAAQRMEEATGRKSMTIAGFLNQVEQEAIVLGHGTVVVVDEMSMVDAILMYRLLRHIPPGTKLVLVGDPSQLPPIGPGLTLHALVGIAAIPQTTLKVTQRQTSESGIPLVANAVREHRAPTFAPYQGKGNGVSFVACDNDNLDTTVQRIYADFGGSGSDYSVQVLCVTKGDSGGTKNINWLFHSLHQQDAEQVFIHDPEFGSVGMRTRDMIPLCVGDLVMYTENDYDLGLRNGSLGRVIEGRRGMESRESICCVCEFDGMEYQLDSTQADALRHAYAITVHKSQGSQFKRVIIPVRSMRKTSMLDQALIYTAITRGVEQVILVGDMEAALAAIKAPASATRRHVTLPYLLTQPTEA
ncbi:AAA family ATPase [Noviherbaspirillum soli]|uniref:AAA family ATPase n=1 Tax=Noviherbaspirillum soli TaxID=1064518 RepID=UPI00188B316F|nr:AAA family ATPase [Noviherbaspirillum soli]